MNNQARAATPAALRLRPPEATLRWVADAIGAGSRITRIRRLTLGGWHANHAITVVDRHGAAHRLVVRRWARPEWVIEDPDFTAAREVTALNLLAASPVCAPGLLAADVDAIVCDVPTLLISRLPGRPPGLPRDMGAFLAGLAEALLPIHAIEIGAPTVIPDYRTYNDLQAAVPPRWSEHPKLWARALRVAGADPPLGPHCFIHRDYHPENTLWSRHHMTGVVDWTQACRGSAAVDTAHMRWNLALTYGLDAAEEFLRLHRSLAGPLASQRYWDVVTVLDVLVELDRGDWPRFDLQRLESYLQHVLDHAD